MKKLSNALAAIVISALVTSCGSGDNAENADASNEEMEQIIKNNPLIQAWKGDFGGLPPFDYVKVADLEPAMRAAMYLKLKEIDKIANTNEAANFKNTIEAMELSGNAFDRVLTVYGVWSSSMSNEEFQKVETVMEPELSSFSDKIIQNEKLFKRIEAVKESEEFKSLTSEQQRLIDDYYKSFVRSGANLDAEAKKELSDINSELAGLFTKFSQNLLSDENNLIVEISSQEQLAGLPQSLIDAAASAAKARGLEGKWVINNTRSSVDPFLTYSENRDLREKVWKMYINRGDNGTETDNNAIITKILNLRAQRAAILGFETHAHWRLQNTMAKTPEKAIELMESVWAPAVERVHEEVADMQKLADKEGKKIKIMPWDYRFYAEKVRKDKYDLDQNEVKPYLQLEKLREGMFWVAGELFGFEFSKLEGIPVYHPDVRVWEVKNKETSAHVGLWYFDAYAREGKRSGAWMNNYRDQYRIKEEVTTIVSNNSNFVKGNEGEPVLISWDDANTLFHEFGHALHGLSSNVTYKSLSGTAVVRDYVEFPSQLLEHWLSTPEVLNNYALHYKTGEPIPQAIVDKINKAATFNEGFATTEYLASALIDMKIHLSKEANIDPDAFEATTLASLGMPDELVMRHRTPQFAHIFSGDSYSAGYYSYLWSDVLTSDAYEAFTEAGGPYDKEVAKRLIDNVFSVGNTIDPAEGYKKFRGKDPDTKALMRKRGFPVK